MIHDETYLDTLYDILNEGVTKGDRTGTGTVSRFGMQMRFDLSAGFPLLTTKRVHFKSVIWELLWMMRGSTHVKWLQDRGVRIWNEWAYENGDLGPIYGKQWRSWDHMETGGDGVRAESIDQLANVVETLKTNPDCRRMIVSAWNVGDVDKMALPPCHLLFQFYVADGKLSCQLYQRSADMFLGVPFNIASYSTLIHIMAHLTGLQVGEFIWAGGDCHIYSNHMDQVNKQMDRTGSRPPTLTIAPDAPTTLDGDWKLEHFVLEGYNPQPGIKAPVAI